MDWVERMWEERVRVERGNPTAIGCCKERRGREIKCRPHYFSKSSLRCKEIWGREGLIFIVPFIPSIKLNSLFIIKFQYFYVKGKNVIWLKNIFSVPIGGKSDRLRRFYIHIGLRSQVIWTSSTYLHHKTLRQ